MCLIYFFIYKIAVKVDAQFCDDTRDNNTCSASQEIAAMEQCQYLRMMNVAFSHLLEKSQPPFFCPIKRGSILFHELPIDGEALAR